jgi:hypothetical protein
MNSSPLGVYIGNVTGEEHIVVEDVNEFNDPQELLVVHTSLSMDTAAWHTDMCNNRGDGDSIVETTGTADTSASAVVSGMGKYDTQNFELAMGKENSGW